MKKLALIAVLGFTIFAGLCAIQLGRAVDTAFADGKTKTGTVGCLYQAGE